MEVYGDIKVYDAEEYNKKFPKTKEKEEVTEDGKTIQEQTSTGE